VERVYIRRLNSVGAKYVVKLNLSFEVLNMDSQEVSYWFDGSGDDEETYNDITERDLRGCHL
jgi:hypothetical protein